MKSVSQPAWQFKAKSTAAVLLAILATPLTGCSYMVSSSAPPEPQQPAADESAGPAAADQPPPAQTPALTDAERARVESLLDRADRAIAADHLTYPAVGSALALYDEVRILDPDNETARRGLERIVERYLELAMSAADQGRLDAAGAMLDRAGLVDPEHPGIAPVRARLALLDDAERRVIALDGEQLRNRDPALTETLHQAGAASRSDGCRAEITARNDSEGRWIYQQMSAAAGQTRIQAQLTIGSPARIEVLCFRP